MSRAKVSLILMVVSSVVALTASSASAKIKFEWKVGGATLAAGEKRTFTSTTDGRNIDLSGTVAGAAILLLSKELSVEPGAIIKGGKPGTSEETVVFKNVTVDKPTTCVVESLPNPEVGTVRTARIVNEIVEGENGEVLILFKPKEGNIFFTLRLLDKSATETCPVKNLEVNFTGSFLALPLPQLTEVLTEHLIFEAAEKNFFLSSGTLNKAGLAFAGNAATLTGLALILLEKHEKFGAF